MITKTLSPGPELSAPPRAPKRRTLRLVSVGLAFFVFTLAAGAVVFPPILGMVGIHVAARGGALLALLAWVPSALYVVTRSVAAANRARSGQRERLSSSAVFRDSL